MSDWFSKDVDLAVAAQLKMHFAKERVEEYPFVTVSRMYGCDGKRTASLIAEKMNKDSGDTHWTVVSREMILEASEKGQLTEETLNELDRFGHSEVKSYIRNTIFGRDNLVETVSKVSKIFQLFAKRGRTVFLGAGSSIITQGVEHSVHVQLYAPEEWRVKNHAKRWSLDESVARTRVRDRTIDREAFVKTFLGQNLYDSTWYDLMINNARVSADEASDMVVQLVKDRM
ncbi:MAG: cytidylate kinase-like family protein [Acidobacteriota bacterium]|nr:cytidylate kinase-like family protein [Acidobacteriota bacterium]